MKQSIISFFEIPAVNFDRAVAFYESVLNIEISVYACEQAKMGCFPEEEGGGSGAISWSQEGDLKPSDQGVLISLQCEDMETSLVLVEQNGGKILIPKTKIEVDGKGYFAVFIDSEGNRVGLYAEK
jgi:predicted enzyme related to lactoylglutathione lyase